MTPREIALLHVNIRRLARAARMAGERGEWEIARINLQGVRDLVAIWERHLKTQRKEIK